MRTTSSLSKHEVRGYLPVVTGVNQPGAVTSRRVKIRVVWRVERTVEVPQPFPTGWNITVDLITKVLKKHKPPHIRN